MPNRWLVISHEAGNSGAPRMLLDLLRGVSAAQGPSWDCEMIFNQGGPLFEQFAQFGQVHRLSGPWTDGGGLVARCGRGLMRELGLKRRRFSHFAAEWTERGPGVIFSNTGTNGRLLAALPEGAGRVVSYVHELEYGLRRFNRTVDWAATIARTDLFLAVSSAVVADLTSLGVDEKRIRFLPNFLPAMPAKMDEAAAQVRSRLGVAANVPLVIGCGHIERNKGTEIFVQMARQVQAARQKPLAFAWLGRDADVRLAREMRAAAGNSVHFAGEVSNAETYFAASDLVVVTSQSESFSRVALEAGSLGRPVLAFAAARGPSDLLPHECLVAERSAPALATAVQALLENPAELGRRGEVLRRRIESGFLAQQWIDKVISWVEDAKGV